MNDYMRYSVVIHKDPDSDYGVTVPSLPGCFSVGTTIDEALDKVVEAIECHIEGLLIDGDPVPAPQEIEVHKDNPDYADGVWAIVSVKSVPLFGEAVRVNVTFRGDVLTEIDRHVLGSNETRSGLLANAAMYYIANISNFKKDKEN